VSATSPAPSKSSGGASVSEVPDSRDKLVPKLPSASVSAQLATPVENHLDDDYTGQHRAMPQDERQRHRDKLRDDRRSRSDSARLDRHDDKFDQITDDITEIKVAISPLPKFMEDVRKVIDGDREREREVETAKAVAEVKAEVKDKLERRGERRKLIMKILGAGAAVVVVAAVHKILQLWLPWL
jgi:hypothetical protein